VKASFGLKYHSQKYWVPAPKLYRISKSQRSAMSRASCSEKVTPKPGIVRWIVKGRPALYLELEQSSPAQPAAHSAHITFDNFAARNMLEHDRRKNKIEA
jgi:hypothetical protein